MKRTPLKRAPFHQEGRFASPSQQKEILQRDGFACGYCDVTLTAESAVFDHVVPWKAGGKTELNNLVVCCRDCNRQKLR